MTSSLDTGFRALLFPPVAFSIIGGFLLVLLSGFESFGGENPMKERNILVPDWTRSYQLYQQPHAIWLGEDTAVGANLGTLNHVLTAAEKKRQIPELVVYTIPIRDLGQSSEGGFKNFDDYLADNRMNAQAIKAFVKRTGLRPRVYLEPDGLALAIQYRRDTGESAESQRIYKDRITAFPKLVQMYKDAGALVYMDAGHSGWFDYADSDIQSMARTLNEAGVGQADGLVTNVSNRQKVMEGENGGEVHYLRRLLPLLDNKKLAVVVDTSRNGGSTHQRLYALLPNGSLVDNEFPSGRLVGSWRRDSHGEIWFHPFFGAPKSLTRLLKKEKYQFLEPKMLLLAPPWLDPVGDVKLGPPPTDAPPLPVREVVQRFRHVKPPDDCDGSLNCPPGQSKHDITVQTLASQPKGFSVDKAIWSH